MKKKYYMISGSTYRIHWVNKSRPHWSILDFKPALYDPLILILWVGSTTHESTQPIPFPKSCCTSCFFSDIREIESYYLGQMTGECLDEKNGTAQKFFVTEATIAPWQWWNGLDERLIMKHMRLDRDGEGRFARLNRRGLLVANAHANVFFPVGS